MDRLINAFVLISSLLLGSIATAIAFFGRHDYTALSGRIYEKDAAVMDSHFLEIVLTPSFAIVLSGAMITLLTKEWLIGGAGKRLAINLLSLVIFSFLLGSILYTMNAPIWDY